MGSKKELDLEEGIALESDMDLDGMDDIDDDELTLDEEPSGNQVLQSTSNENSVVESVCPQDGHLLL